MGEIADTILRRERTDVIYNAEVDRLEKEYANSELYEFYDYLFEDEIIEYIGSIEGIAKGKDCLEEIEAIKQMTRELKDNVMRRAICVEAADKVRNQLNG